MKKPFDLRYMLATVVSRALCINGSFRLFGANFQAASRHGRASLPPVEMASRTHWLPPMPMDRRPLGWERA